MNKHKDYKKIIPDISLTIALIIVIITVDILINVFSVTIDNSNVVFHIIIFYISIKTIYNLLNKILISYYENKKGIHK